MKIRTKILLGYSVMCLLLLVSGGAGYYGVRLLNNSLDFLAGPAWDTADGSMNSTIEIQNQIIAANEVTRGHQPEENLRTIKASGQTALDETERMIAAGLIENASVDQLRKARDQYMQHVDHMLGTWDRYRDARESFDKHTDLFVSLGEQLEEIGDGAVEKIQSEPDTAISWNSGLATKWEAADGGMEASIGFLTQLYHVNRITADFPFEAEKMGLDEAIAFQTEAVNGMLDTGLFNGTIEEGPFKGETYAAAYRAELKKHFEEMGTLVKSYTDFIEAEHSYRVSAESLREVLEKIEGEGDQRVEQQASLIVSTRQTALTTIVGAIAGGLLAAMLAAWLTLRSITRPIAGIVSRLKDIAEGEGDLTQRIEIRSKDELGELSEWFNSFVSKVHSLIREITQTSNRVREGACGIADSNGTLAQSLNDQTTRIASVSAAVEEMSSSVIEVARQASDANANATQSGEAAREGEAVVGRTINGMQTINKVVSEAAASVGELGRLGEQIGQVITVINDIADQTNLLALNAAIEAARAGEHGRGFAVVADEVRKLADRTTKATDEIAGSIQTIQSRTREAVDQMQAGTKTVSEGVKSASEAGERLRSIVSASSKVAGLIERIAAASEEQSQAGGQIASDIESINVTIQETTEITHTSVNHARELSEQADRLAQMIGKFKV